MRGKSSPCHTRQAATRWFGPRVVFAALTAAPSTGDFDRYILSAVVGELVVSSAAWPLTSNEPIGVIVNRSTNAGETFTNYRGIRGTR